jgi:ADP-heptose:LPS heptosyltransferase
VLVAGIGDFVMATPALRSIRKGFPAAGISLLTTPQAAGLAAHCPYLDQVATFDLRAFRPDERGTGWQGRRRLRELTATLRERRFDLAVDLYRVATVGGALRMWLLLRRLRARRTAGRWSGGHGCFFGLRAPDRSHETDAMLSLAAALGCPSDDQTPEIWIPEASRQSARARIQELDPSGPGPYVVLNIGSNRETARLPIPKAVGIGQEIRRVLGLRIFLTGDSSEAPTAAAVAAQIDGAVSLAGRTDLLELAAVLDEARLVVTTDSGPMHLAAAARTPLVALYGPADPTHYGPRGRPGRILVLQGRLMPRDPLRWHADLTAADVVEAARTLLAAHPETPMG